MTNLLHILLCKVLIETLWNVKQIGRGEYLNSSPVLIETLWNVKSKRVDTIPSGAWY